MEIYTECQAINLNLKQNHTNTKKLHCKAQGKRYGYFMEMGTGKSKVLIDELGMLFTRGEVNFALIIAPKGVYRNWVAKEIPEHLSDDVPHRVIRWVANPNKTQQKELHSIQNLFWPNYLCYER